MRCMPSINAMILTAAMAGFLPIAASMLGPVPARAADPAPPAAPAAEAPTAPADTPAEPQLKVATVKMEGGWRASKLIGAAVYNEQDQKVGSVDDLILTQQDKVVIAVVSVGGFLGVGGKLVAVPYNELRFGKDERMVLPGATKDALQAMPGFTYGS
jgi:sporulation protein YlmC with PRC-barrel domain